MRNLVLAALLGAVTLMTPSRAQEPGTSPFGRNPAAGEQRAAPWAAKEVLRAWREDRLRGKGDPETPNSAPYRSYGFGRPVTTERAIALIDRSVDSAERRIDGRLDRESRETRRGVATLADDLGERVAAIWPWLLAALLLGLIALAVAALGWLLPRSRAVAVVTPAPTAPAVAACHCCGHIRTSYGCGCRRPHPCPNPCPTPPPAYPAYQGGCGTSKAGDGMPADGAHDSARRQLSALHQRVDGLETGQTAHAGRLATAEKSLALHSRALTKVGGVVGGHTKALGGLHQEVAEVNTALASVEAEARRREAAQRENNSRLEEILASLG